MIKRIVAVVLALVAVFACFALYGCGGNDVIDDITAITESEWRSAFSEDKFENVGVKFTYINRELGDIQCCYSRLVGGERYDDNIKYADDKSLQKLIEQLKDKYDEFEYQSADIYASDELKIDGYSNVRVSFSDEGLNAVNMTKDGIEKTIYFFGYGSTLKSSSKCKHDWVYGQACGFYCFDCHLALSKYADNATEGLLGYEKDKKLFDGFYCADYVTNQGFVYYPTEMYGDGYKITYDDSRTYYCDFTESSPGYGSYEPSDIIPDYPPMASIVIPGNASEDVTVYIYSEGIAVWSYDSRKDSVFYDHTFDGNMIFELEGTVYEFATAADGTVSCVVHN